MDLDFHKICGVDPEEPSDGFCQDDPRAEYFQYKDEGCSYASSCIACPYSRSLYDGTSGKRSWKLGRV